MFTPNMMMEGVCAVWGGEGGGEGVMSQCDDGGTEVWGVGCGAGKREEEERVCSPPA